MSPAENPRGKTGDIKQMLRYYWLRDRVALLLFVLTFVIMSYPFVLRMHSHLPMDNVDTHQALWQNWWVLEALTGGLDVNHSPYLFHPRGLDYTLQPPRWTGLLFWTPLYLVFGDPFAFNMTAAIGILLRAYGMYLFGLLLFKRRAASWVCGAFYAFAAANLTHALQQPFTGASEWIPWFMLVFVGGLFHIKSGSSTGTVMRRMLIAAVLFSLNVYANLKIGIFAMLLGGGFVLLYMVAHQLWKRRLFWQAMAVFGLACVVLCAPSLIPMLSADGLSVATVDAVVTGPWGGMDVLSYIKADHARPLHYMQSIASLSGDRLENVFVTWGLSHVGLVSVAFATMGFVYAVRVRREMLIWCILALVFWLLSLGVEVFVNRTMLDWYWTPYHFVQDNVIFRALKWPFRMALVFLFPFAVLIGGGLHYRLGSLELGREQKLLLVVSVVMLLYGTSIFPIPTRDAPRPPYLLKLAQLPEGAVIDVPFGRHVSKYYMSLQRFHQRPMAEGMIARTPPGTYDYIDGNLLLATFRDPSKVDYEAIELEDWQAAFTELLDDGFRYVVMHREVPVSRYFVGRVKGWALQMFGRELKVYDDGNVIIYDIADVNVEKVASIAKRVFTE